MIGKCIFFVSLYIPLFFLSLLVRFGQFPNQGVSFSSMGRPLAWEMAANAHITDAFVSSVVKGEALADVSMLAFRDPDRFVAGELHRHAEAWSRTSPLASCHLAPQVLPWIENCVDVQDFFKPFKGSYKGEEYDSALPPQRIFLNHPSRKPSLILSHLRSLTDCLLVLSRFRERLARSILCIW